MHGRQARIIGRRLERGQDELTALTAKVFAGMLPVSEGRRLLSDEATLRSAAQGVLDERSLRVLLSDPLAGVPRPRRSHADVTELRNVRLTFFDEKGGKPGTLTSRTGEYDVRTGIMIARGNVVLITHNERGEKRTVRSEELHYDQRGDRVWSERETIVEEKTRTLVSEGFTSDTRFTNIQGRNSKSTGVQVNGAGGGL